MIQKFNLNSNPNAGLQSQADNLGANAPGDLNNNITRTPLNSFLEGLKKFNEVQADMTKKIATTDATRQGQVMAQNDFDNGKNGQSNNLNRDKIINQAYIDRDQNLRNIKSHNIMQDERKKQLDVNRNNPDQAKENLEAFSKKLLDSKFLTQETRENMGLDFEKNNNVAVNAIRFQVHTKEMKRNQEELANRADELKAEYKQAVMDNPNPAVPSQDMLEIIKKVEVLNNAMTSEGGVEAGNYRGNAFGFTDDQIGEFQHQLRYAKQEVDYLDGFRRALEYDRAHPVRGKKLHKSFHNGVLTGYSWEELHPISAKYKTDFEKNSHDDMPANDQHKIAQQMRDTIKSDSIRIVVDEDKKRDQTANYIEQLLGTNLIIDAKTKARFKSEYKGKHWPQISAHFDATNLVYTMMKDPKYAGRIPTQQEIAQYITAYKAPETEYAKSSPQYRLYITKYNHDITNFFDEIRSGKNVNDIFTYNNLPQNNEQAVVNQKQKKEATHVASVGVQADQNSGGTGNKGKEDYLKLIKEKSTQIDRVFKENPNLDFNQKLELMNNSLKGYRTIDKQRVIDNLKEKSNAFTAALYAKKNGYEPLNNMEDVKKATIQQLTFMQNKIRKEEPYLSNQEVKDKAKYKWVNLMTHSNQDPEQIFTYVKTEGGKDTKQILDINKENGFDSVWNDAGGGVNEIENSDVNIGMWQGVSGLVKHNIRMYIPGAKIGQRYDGNKQRIASALQKTNLENSDAFATIRDNSLIYKGEDKKHGFMYSLKDANGHSYVVKGIKNNNKELFWSAKDGKFYFIGPNKYTGQINDTYTEYTGIMGF